MESEKSSVISLLSTLLMLRYGVAHELLQILSKLQFAELRGWGSVIWQAVALFLHFLIVLEFLLTSITEFWSVKLCTAALGRLNCCGISFYGHVIKKSKLYQVLLCVT